MHLPCGQNYFFIAFSISEFDKHFLKKYNGLVGNAIELLAFNQVMGCKSPFPHMCADDARCPLGARLSRHFSLYSFIFIKNIHLFSILIFTPNCNKKRTRLYVRTQASIAVIHIWQVLFYELARRVMSYKAPSLTRPRRSLVLLIHHRTLKGEAIYAQPGEP